MNRSATIDVRGTRLAYAERGAGQPVLFIHGTGTYSATFEPVLNELPKRVRAITYDRRGFAASAGPLASGLGEHIEDAAALLDALDAAPATIVGSSSGEYSRCVWPWRGPTSFRPSF